MKGTGYQPLGEGEIDKRSDKQSMELPALPSRPITYDGVEDPEVRDLLYRVEGDANRVRQGNVALWDKRVDEYLEGVHSGVKKTAEIERLQEASTIDSLTGLRNRRAFDEAFPISIERATRRIPNLGFLIFDLDNFKDVNDEHGHDAGDAVLRQFADLLKSLCRKTEQPFRWGGEEFVVIADVVDLEAAVKFAERVRKAVDDYKFILPDGTVLKKTTSVGITSMKEFNGSVTSGTADILMQKADEALYEAKKTGRNMCVAALRDGTFKKA
ncbi:MAG: GGDEF domain-containing protein [Candidatus Gracilibacteria bacterium]